MGNLQESVHGILRNLRSLEGLKELFREQLDYDLINLPISRQDWPEGAAASLAEDPLLLAGQEDFHIIYGRLNGTSNLPGADHCESLAPGTPVCSLCLFRRAAAALAFCQRQVGSKPG